MKKYLYEECGFYGRIKKILFVMKLTIVAFFLGLISLSASITYSQNKKITLDLEGATLLDVFLTPDRAIPTNNNEKVIKEEMQQPQKKDIRGSVTDASGIPLPGATVMVKGTTVGTITDADGKYTLSIPVDAKILSISFIGMVSQEISLGNQMNLNIALKEASVDVGEVAVVGYGIQKKATVVGAISQTNGEVLKRSGGVTDLKQALTGNLPGVTTITSSGEPGGYGTGQSSTNIYIRGVNTWNVNQPLILVDGVERLMDNIDVNEVETISVLKDASATAVFGVKGANGVILITTKRGTVGKPKISFSYNTTAKMISKLPQKLDSYQALLIRNEAIEREVVLNEPSWGDYTPNEIVNRYKLPQTSEYALIYPNVDWEKAMFKDVGTSHHATMSVQGGTNFVSYFGSFAYLHEGDMFKKYDNHKGYDPSYAFNRFNFRSNLDFKVTNTTNLRVDLSGYYGLKNTNFSGKEATDSQNPQLWATAYRFPPDAHIIQFPNGRWGLSPLINPESLPNPIAMAYNVGICENRSTQLNSDFTLEQKLDFITKGLNAKASLFYDNSSSSQGGLNDVTNHIRPDAGGNTPEEYVFPNLYTGPDQDPSGYTQLLPVGGRNQFDFAVQPWNIVQENTGTISRRMMYQFQINYARKFGLHNVTAMGLVKREEYASGSEFKHYREDWVARVTYDFNSRYLFEANGAYNGSEQFGPGYRFGFFPSLAAGWVVSNEKFFKVDFIDRLKLRFSSGMVGSDNVGSTRWLYSSQYSYSGASPLNQNPSQSSPYKWYNETVVGNPNLHWEKARKNDFGLEMGLFKNLISVTYDYFTDDRTDILIAGGSRKSIPPYFGATPPSANLGHVKANGHEIEVKFDKRVSNSFRYWATFAMTHTDNKILAYDEPVLSASYIKATGYAVGQTKSPIRTGFYNNWDQIYASVPQEANDLSKLPGFYNILDFNADGIIKSADDYEAMGYPENPRNSYNYSLGAEYKGFSVMLQFYGVNNVSRNIPLTDFDSNNDILFGHVLDHWSKDNPTASSYLPRWKTPGQFIGDYWIYDGSYLRLKTAEIAYSFQDKFVKRAGVSALRIYLNGENLWFWSNLPDDREAALNGGSASLGAYPSVKRINLGIDITF